MPTCHSVCSATGFLQAPYHPSTQTHSQTHVPMSACPPSSVGALEGSQRSQQVLPRGNANIMDDSPQRASHPSSCLTLKIPLQQGSNGHVTDGETEAQGGDKAFLVTQLVAESVQPLAPRAAPTEAEPVSTRPGPARTSRMPVLDKNPWAQERCAAGCSSALPGQVWQQLPVLTLVPVPWSLSVCAQVHNFIFPALKFQLVWWSFHQLTTHGENRLSLASMDSASSSKSPEDWGRMRPEA